MSTLLPPLPDHASGVLCTRTDGIDRTNPDFMRGKIQALMNTPEFYESGWSVQGRAYAIPKLFSTHSNVELVKPDGKTVGGLDTQQIDRKTGAIKGYFPGGDFAAPVLDDCKEGDSVAIPKQLQGQETIKSGTGPEALLEFARQTERARMNSDRNYNYAPINPEASKHEANSNSFARSLAKLGGIDLDPTFNRYSTLGAPGLGVDLTQRAYPKSAYDGMTPDEFVKNPKMLERFYDDLKQLHPLTQQRRAIEFGRQATPAPASPEPVRP